MEQTPKKSRVGRDVDNNKDENTNDHNKVSKSWQELTYDVWCIVFKYLNGLDLSIASEVCRSWLELANSEKKIRGPSCVIRNKEELRYKPSSWEAKRDIINSSMVKPSLSLFFIVGQKASHEQGRHRNFLPANCNSVTLNGYGVVRNNTEIEEDEDKESIVGMFLPEVPTIEISTLTFNLHDWKRLRFTCCEQLQAMFKTSNKNHSRMSSCLMLFCDWDGRSIALRLLQSLKYWFPVPKPCVWGGIAKDLSICNFVNSTPICKKNANCVAIAISGPNMRAWSTLLDANCNTKEKVEDKLRTFKDNVRLRKHSMGFMFACCKRGTEMYHESNVESSIFKRLFPKVPLVGCFGDGEFGKNIISDTPNKNPRIEWDNSVSTAFMIITYN